MQQNRHIPALLAVILVAALAACAPTAAPLPDDGATQARLVDRGAQPRLGFSSFMPPRF